MKSLTLMKSLTSLDNEDGALHLMKRRRPHFSCSPIFIPSLAKRLHSFISPLGRLHFRRVTAMLQKTSLWARAERQAVFLFLIHRITAIPRRLRHSVSGCFPARSRTALLRCAFFRASTGKGAIVRYRRRWSAAGCRLRCLDDRQTASGRWRSRG